VTFTSNAADSGSGSPRKPYATPRLISYGHVKDIVQGSTGPMTGDSAGTTKPIACWVAEALYGVNDPRTMLLRGWLSEVYIQRRRWWFLVALYMRFGPATAKLIYSGHLPRRLLLPLFNVLTVKAFEESAGTIRAATH
jgi:hypothetical protein